MTAIADTVSRRLMAAIVLGLLSLTSAVAQRQYSPEFYLGAHAGATLSRMSIMPSAPQSMLPGFMVGLTARYTEENHFGIIAELNIQQRGWKENFEGEPFRYSRTLTYIQLPLMTHIYFGSRKFRGYFNAGPEVGLMLGSRISANFDYENYKDVPGFPMRNRTNEQLSMKIRNRFDYGISAGLGAEWYVTPRHAVNIEGRFYYGLGNIFPSSKSDRFSASRGWSIEILAGYQFRVR